jgi:NADPH:quinone reductase-like Zn-dependent oxidoreductase
MVLSGQVESVGTQVTHFQKGNQVYALNITRFGMYAEYTCLPENSVLALKPSTVTYIEQLTSTKPCS